MASSSSSQQQQNQPNLAVYVIHSDKLKGIRSQTVSKLRKIFTSAKKDKTKSFNCVLFDVVSDYDDTTFTRESTKELTHIDPDGLNAPFDRAIVPMNVNQLSNAMKHYTALKKIATSGTSPGDASLHLVLEDDVLFNEELMEASMHAALRSATVPDWDVLFMGLPNSFDNTDENNVKFQAVDSLFKIIPSCESYLVSKKAAARLTESFLPIRFPTHTHLSWLLLDQKSRRQQQQQLSLAGKLSTSSSDLDTPFKPFVISPSIFLDGSKYGTCTSTLNVNNRLSWNPWYIKLFALVRDNPSEELKDEDAAQADKIYESMNFKTHPDALHLYAQSYVRRNDHRKAAELMAAAYDGYERNGCIMNRSSEFLNAYCDLFLNLQQ